MSEVRILSPRLRLAWDQKLELLRRLGGTSARCKILGSDLFRIEFLHGSLGRRKRLTEVHRGVFAKSERVAPRDHEGLQIGTLEASRLESLDDLDYTIIEREQPCRAAFPDRQSGLESFVEEGLDAPDERLIGASREAWPCLVAQPEGEQGRL